MPHEGQGLIRVINFIPNIKFDQYEVEIYLGNERHQFYTRYS